MTSGAGSVSYAIEAIRTVVEIYKSLSCDITKISRSFVSFETDKNVSSPWSAEAAEGRPATKWQTTSGDAASGTSMPATAARVVNCKHDGRLL